MDEGLRKQLQSIERQVEVLYEAQDKYLTLDAASDRILSKLSEQYEAVLSTPTKPVSEAQLSRLAKGHEEWAAHKTAVAIAKADFDRQKHLLDLKNKAYDALHLSLKIDSGVIKRQL